MNTATVVVEIVRRCAPQGMVRALRGPKEEVDPNNDRDELFLELPSSSRETVIALATQCSTDTETIRVYDDQGVLLFPERPRP